MMTDHNSPIEQGNPALSQRPLLPRREFLYASGAVGAALVAGRLARSGPRQAATIRRARPGWFAGPRATPTQADWNALRNQLSTHRLYQPGQSGYVLAHQLFSPQYDSLQPAGVAYCKTAADVGLCLSFVTKFSLAVRMRSGGHSYGGWSSVTGGLIVDVTEMNSMTFGTGTVTVGTGIDLINFYAGLAARGKAVPGGSCPTVGIAGLTLGGGIGVLSRKYGLTSDNLRALDVVTAAGDTLTCSPSSNEPLYWASRGGGGGNFGVATSLTFGTSDLATLVLFFITWPWSQAARVIRGWQSWLQGVPDELWSNLHLSSNFGGLPSVMVGGTFVGSKGDAETQVGKLYHLVGVGPSHASFDEHTFLDAMLHEAGCTAVAGCNTPPGGHLPRVPFYAKSDFFSKPFSSSGINALIAGIERLRAITGASPGTSAGSIAFDALGGAVNKMAPDATAFVHRNALFSAQYYTGWTWPGTATGRANQLAWIRAYYKAIHPNANGEAYQNYPDPDLVNWQQAYYGANYPMLQAVKATYDPKGLFTFPQAITA